MSNRLPSLGDLVKCKITGFSGIVTTHAKHLSGCDRLWVTPPIGADGKMMEGCWIDIDMVEIVKPAVLEPVTYEKKAPGGRDLPPSR